MLLPPLKKLICINVLETNLCVSSCEPLIHISFKGPIPQLHQNATEPLNIPDIINKYLMQTKKTHVERPNELDVQLFENHYRKPTCVNASDKHETRHQIGLDKLL